MESEIILKRINWNTHKKNALLVDLKRAFLLMYKKNYDFETMRSAWEIVSEKAPFLAYELLEDNISAGKVQDASVIRDIIWKHISLRTSYDEKSASDLLVLTALLGRDVPPQTMEFVRNLDNISDVCSESLKKIHDYNSGRAHINVFILLRLLYQFNIDVTAIESGLGKRKFTLPQTGIKRDVYSFISQLIVDSAFTLAYLIMKAYTVTDYSVFDISDEDVYNSLIACGEHSFFRGGLIYKEFLKLSIEDDTLLLKKWYLDLCRIKTPIAQSENPGFRLLFVCQAIQLEPKDPESILRDLSINLSNIPSVEMTRKQYIREYRKAIYALIINNQIDWCRRFIQKTYNNNIDKYVLSEEVRNPGIASNGVRDQLGKCNEFELLNALIWSNSSAQTVVYIYMNSFVRCLISYARFVNESFVHYGNQIIKSLQDYDIGGSVTFSIDRNDENKRFYYLEPNTVIKKRGDPLYLDTISSDILSRIDFDQHISWFQTHLYAYNPAINDNPDKKGFTFSIVGYGDQRLDNLIEQLENFKYRGIITPDLVESVHYTNISLVDKSESSFVELCILILEAVVSCCSDKEKLFELLDGIRSANYYAYYYNKNSTKERSLYIDKEQFPDIKKRSYRSWNTLLESNLEVMDCFNIYRNTILRRMFCLSDFMAAFVNPKDYGVFFERVGELNGEVQTFSYSETNEDNMALFIGPSEFQLKHKNKKRYKTSTDYDQFLIEIPLYGKTATSYRNKNMIKKHKPVSFEIVDYNNDGLFKVKIKKWRTIV